MQAASISPRQLAQRGGGPIEVIRPGDRVFFEPGEDHWHGAALNRFMTHLSMVEVDEKGNSATWGVHVSDHEYAAAPTVEESQPSTQPWPHDAIKSSGDRS